MVGWIILILFLAITLLFILRGTYETFHLDVSFSILGEGNRALRIFLFSDLHAGACRISEKKFRKAVQSAQVDAFLFAGDMTCDRRDQEKARKYMSLFASLAREAGVPIYAVPGNHDHYILNEQLSDLGIVLLRNQNTPIEAKDRSLWLLAGLEDLRIGSPSYEAALKNPINGKYSMGTSTVPDISANFAEPYGPAHCANCPVVVLAHNPDAVFSLPRKISPENKNPENSFKNDSEFENGSENDKLTPPLFLLSGHFHGGQIWMPFHLEYRVLRHEIMPKIGFYKGAYTKDGIAGYISRGLGCVIVPFRLFSYPELAVLELRVK